MKTTTLIIPLLLLLYTISLFAQEPLDYYPLHVGDKRVYEIEKGVPRRIEPIVRDSVDTEHSLYFYFGNFTTTTAKVIDKVHKTVQYADTKDKSDLTQSKVLTYRLDVQVHETYPIINQLGDTLLFHQLIEEFDGQILGRRVKTRHYWKYPNRPIHEGSHEYLAEGIGYILRTQDVGSDIEYLVGCIVNGDTLGDVSDITTSVDEQASTPVATVFPNPTSDRVFVNTGVMSHSPITTEVVNLFGIAIPIHATRIATDVVSFDVSQFEQGTYIVRYKIDNYFAQAQFVVIR
ncbi:MAG: T9SS type A sorting domain-containing protein [Candidatus Kapaibacterium sp.]|nr:T9SS type A sorting domain-containing protein [Bacteroidota bacterium]